MRDPLGAAGSIIGIVAFGLKLAHQFHNQESEKRSLQAKYDKVVADLGDNEATIREQRHIVTALREEIEHCRQEIDGFKAIPAGVPAWRRLKNRWKPPKLRTPTISGAYSCWQPQRHAHEPSRSPPPMMSESLHYCPDSVMFYSAGLEIEKLEIDMEILRNEPVPVRRFSEFVSTASDDDEDADGSGPGIESDSVTTRKEFGTWGNSTSTQAEPPRRTKMGRPTPWISAGNWILSIWTFKRCLGNTQTRLLRLRTAAQVNSTIRGFDTI
ncbi:hypothetical protein PG997_006355 [Apiospora hydei]|uniref:Fungal N-terminal domain-containing protein n=1 Tax=Apiospora hydei TaxID=1337664 RepID=A0ABR1WRS5_9PEZI